MQKPAAWPIIGGPGGPAGGHGDPAGRRGIISGGSSRAGGRGGGLSQWRSQNSATVEAVRRDSHGRCGIMSPAADS